jgi:hypothetical protein
MKIHFDPFNSDSLEATCQEMEKQNRSIESNEESQKHKARLLDIHILPFISAILIAFRASTEKIKEIITKTSLPT